jgi:serine/threonine protein kinase
MPTSPRGHGARPSCGFIQEPGQAHGSQTQEHLGQEKFRENFKAFARYSAFKIIIADFGISSSYTSVTEVCTESPTSFTKTHAAPEVIDQAPRDFSVDMFSLGCVFVEMLAPLAMFNIRKYILAWRKLPGKIFSKAWLVGFQEQKNLE